MASRLVITLWIIHLCDISAEENVNSEGIHDLLVSINERLQNLDVFYGMHKHHGESQMSLDTRLRRIEEKILEFVRKLDDMQERFNHKLGYLEARVDLGLQKIQTNLESTNSRSERSLKVTVSKINEIKQFCNTSADTRRVDRRQSGSEQNGQSACNVNSEVVVDRMSRNMAQQINQANGDIWHRLQSTESLLWRLNNASRTETKERLLQIHDKANEITNFAKNEFGKIELAQDFFLSTCHRIQVNEEVLTTKYTKVLEKILDIILHNSSRTYEEVESAQELIKYHDAHITRTLSDTDKMVLGCQEEGKATRKSIFELQGNLSKDWNKQHNSMAENINRIQLIMQDFHDRIREMESRIQENKSILEAATSQNDLLVKILDALRGAGENDLHIKETFESKLYQEQSNQTAIGIDLTGNGTNSEYSDTEGTDIQDYDEPEEEYVL